MALAKLDGSSDLATSLKPLAERYAKAVATTSAKAAHKEQAQLLLYTQVIPAEKALGEFLGQQAALLQRQQTMQQEIESDGNRAITLYMIAMTAGVMIVGVLGIILYRLGDAAANGHDRRHARGASYSTSPSGWNNPRRMKLVQPSLPSTGYSPRCRKARATSRTRWPP